jgi:TetR/AcrR family transcriptional repressor of nem operon
MQTFWSKGFEATSVDDLCESTGLGRSSLYAAFGDKRALYLRALDRYEEDAARRVAAALAGPLPIRKSIAGFLNRLIDDIVSGPGRRGCFIGNCAAELPRGDREAVNQVRRSLARVEKIFCEALKRSRAKGEIDAKSDVIALSRHFTAGIQGLRLMGKANPDRKVLEDIAKVMLGALDL